MHKVVPATRMAKVEKTNDSEWWQGSEGLKRVHCFWEQGLV